MVNGASSHVSLSGKPSTAVVFGRAAEADGDNTPVSLGCLKTAPAGNPSRVSLSHNASPRASSAANESRLPEVVVSRQRRTDTSFGQKLLDFWHARSGFLMTGAIAGGLFGAGIGALLGGGLFSVPGAIVGATFGVPVGILLSLLCGEGNLDNPPSNPYASFVNPNVDFSLRPKPRQDNALQESGIITPNHGSVLVQTPSLETPKDGANARAAWQKNAANWAKNDSNFVLGNREVRRAWQSNLFGSKAYRKEIAKGYTKGLGWDKIKGFENVETEHAILDFGRLVPGVPKHIPNNLFQGLEHTNVRGIGINASLSVETLPEKLFAGQRQLKDVTIHNNCYEHLLLASDVTDLPEFDYNKMAIAQTGPGQFHVRTFDASGRRSDFTDLPAAAVSMINAYQSGAARNEAAFIEALSAELKCKHPPVPFTSLTHLPEHIFRDLDGLEDLTLSKNKFQTLPPRIFQNQVNLKRLDLSHNEIDSLPDGIFENLHSLQELDLRGNPIKELPSSLRQLPNVKILWDGA